MKSTRNDQQAVRIWVVDDDADCRLLVRDVIATAADSWQVSEIGNGAQALQELRRVAGDPYRRPDLILLDVNMPGMSGLGVLRAAKADPALMDIPIVIFTGMTDPNIRAQAMAIGAAEFFTKPAEAASFQRTVAAAVRHCLPAHSSRFNRAAWREDKKDGR